MHSDVALSFVSSQSGREGSQLNMVASNQAGSLEEAPSSGVASEGPLNTDAYAFS